MNQRPFGSQPPSLCVDANTGVPDVPTVPGAGQSDALDAVIDHHGGYYEYLADELLKREESLRPPAPAASELVDR